MMSLQVSASISNESLRSTNNTTANNGGGIFAQLEAQFMTNSKPHTQTTG